MLDAHGVGDERSRRRSTAGADGDVVVAAPLDEVRGDEEVGGETELVDDVHLVFQALLDLGIGGFLLAIPSNKTFLADAHQVFLARRTVRRAELRVFFRRGGIELDGDVAALGDLQRGVAGPGDVSEKLAHLLRGLEVDLGGVAHAVLVDEQVAGADADHHVVRVMIVAVEKVHVIRGHRLEAEFRGEFQQAGSNAALRLKPVIVDLDVKVILAIDVHELGHRFTGLFLVAR